jgi:hypothetical protein
LKNDLGPKEDAMKSLTTVAVSAVIALAASGCGPKILVPPRIVLDQFDVIGVIEFVTSSKGDLGTYATQRFVEAMRRDQSLVRTLDLGTEAQALASVDGRVLDAGTLRAIGGEHDAATILRGSLEVSDIRPAVSLLGLSVASVAADVDARLTAELIESATGASLWSASARATHRVGQVSVFDGRTFVFDAEHPDRAYGDLVDALVQEVALDFQFTWVRGDR